MNDRASVLNELKSGARVAIIRLRSLGDSVLLTPALALLKQTRPDLDLAVVSEPQFAAVYSGNPAVSRVLTPAVRDLRAFRPQLCINLHGGTRSARLTLFSGAAIKAGFGHFRYRAVYDVRIPRAQAILGQERKVHTAEHAATAMFFLGVPPQEIPAAKLFAQPQFPRFCREPYAVIHPYASAPEKTWPATRFLEIAEHLRREGGIQPVFIAGPRDDVSPFAAWPSLAGAPLEEAKALLAGATLFLGNDSGPAHVAAAFGVPTVVIFGASDPLVWGPWKTESQVLVSDGPIARIATADVWRAVDRLRVHA